MVTTQQTHTSRNQQALETFDIRNFRDQLQPAKEKGKYICPVCQGHNLSINEKTGKYKCFNECECRDIREAIKPWAEVVAERKRANYTLPPKNKSPKRKIASPKQAPIPEGELTLVMLTEPATDIPQPQKLTNKPPKGLPGSTTETIYIYSDSQWVTRYQWEDSSKEKGYDKTFRQWHRLPDGTPEMRKGDKPWKAYRLDEALATAKSVNGVPALLQHEGEGCVEIGRKYGIAGITFQGSAWDKKTITTEYKRALSSGIGVIVFLHDADETGLKKLKTCSDCAAEVGIGFIPINPQNICPNLPYKSSDIKEILAQMETPEFIRRLEEEIHFSVKERSQQLAIDEELLSSFETGDGDWDSADSGHENNSANNQPSDKETEWREQRKMWNSPTSYKGEIGFWRKKRGDDEEDEYFFEPACNFDFQVEREIEDADGGGLVLQVKRSFEKNQIRVILNSTDYTKPDTFTDALKRALGTGIVCNLSKPQLNALIHTRLHEYRTTRQGKVFKRIDRYGQQVDGTWVFRDRQFKKDGTPTNENESGWVFNPALGRDDFIPCPELAEQNPQALNNLLDASRKFFGAKNMYQLLLNIGWVVAGLNFQEIFGHNSSFPLKNSYGAPGGGKTLADETALSLIGKNWAEDGILSRVSTSALYELGDKLGSIPFIWDDPDRNPQNEELAKSWYNAKPRRVRGNQQTPHSPMGIASNHVFGGEQIATYTRILRIAFDIITDGNKAAFQELKAAQAEASGAFPELIAIGYPKETINEIESELLQYLPQAHARIAQNLAIATWYAQKIVEMTGGDENIKQWVIDNCCKSENDSDASGDSLQDYIDKILALEAEASVGDWNFKREVERNGQQFYAIYAHDVWKLVDQRFKPATYNERSLKTLVIKAGGVTDTTVRFSCDRDQVLAYNRALITPRLDSEGCAILPNPPATSPRKAWLIPAHLFGEADEAPETVTEHNQPPVTPPNPYKPEESILSTVTTVTDCNRISVTPQNPDSESTCDPSNTPCNRVTEKNDLKNKKEDEKKVENKTNTGTQINSGCNQNSGYAGYTAFENEKTEENQAFQPVTEDQLQSVTSVTSVTPSETSSKIQNFDVEFKVGDRISCYPNFDYASIKRAVNAKVLEIEVQDNSFMGATVEYLFKKKLVTSRIPGASSEWILSKL